MAYVPLALSDSLRVSVRMVIEKGVEPLLQDAHWMLGTVVGKPTDTAPPRQLQHPIALVLLSTVAGVSEKLLQMQKKAGLGKRFKECLNRYFPWDIYPPEGESPEKATKILYQVFRNPLVHSLGLHKGRDSVVRIGQVFPGTDDAENRVEELERYPEKLGSRPCLVVTPEKRDLWLEPFYLGVRKLVERWSCDDTQVLLAAKALENKFRKAN